MLNSNNINYIKYKFSAGKAAATLANVTSLPFRLRFVMNNYRQTSSVISMMSQLGWEELGLRRARIKTILLFKIVNNLVDIPPEPFLIPTGAITRGHNIRFLQPVTHQNNNHAVFLLPEWYQDMEHTTSATGQA
jgi:hypothetical protein